MTKSVPTPDYPALFSALKERILLAHVSAARAVNHELVLLYWDIGQGIVEKQQTAGWGDGVVERLAADLRSAFPDMRGFSSANLWRMKQFYLTHTSAEFLAHVAQEMEKPKTSFLAQPVRETTVTGTASEQLAQAVRELVSAVPWGHHINALSRLTHPAALRHSCLRRNDDKRRE